MLLSWKGRGERRGVSSRLLLGSPGLAPSSLVQGNRRTAQSRPRGLSSPPVLVMVTGTPWTWTPLMLMVCMAWAAAASWAAFRLMMLPAGAIFGRGRSFRRIAAECFLLVPLGWGARDAGLLQVVVAVVAAVAGVLSWTRTVCTSPLGVRM